MVTVKKFVFNPFMENSYILFDETKECVIIDPGCYYEEEEKILDDFIQENKLSGIDHFPWKNMSLFSEQVLDRSISNISNLNGQFCFFEYTVGCACEPRVELPRTCLPMVLQAQHPCLKWERSCGMQATA